MCSPAFELSCALAETEEGLSLNPYTDTLWGELKTVALPVGHIFDRDGNIELNGSDLSSFVYCCLQANRAHSNCTFAAPVRELEAATSYSHAQLERSLKSLQEKHLIQRLPGPRFKIAEYDPTPASCTSLECEFSQT
jgi:hypothetical protein